MIVIGICFICRQWCFRGPDRYVTIIFTQRTVIGIVGCHIVNSNVVVVGIPVTAMATTYSNNTSIVGLVQFNIWIKIPYPITIPTIPVTSLGRCYRCGLLLTTTMSCMHHGNGRFGTKFLIILDRRVHVKVVPFRLSLLRLCCIRKRTVVIIATLVTTDVRIENVVIIDTYSFVLLLLLLLIIIIITFIIR